MMFFGVGPGDVRFPGEQLASALLCTVDGDIHTHRVGGGDVHANGEWACKRCAPQELLDKGRHRGGIVNR